MKFFNAAKHRRISMLVVMVMLLQVLMPVVGDVVWAEEGGPEPVEVVEEPATKDDTGGTMDLEDVEDEEEPGDKEIPEDPAEPGSEVEEDADNPEEKESLIDKVLGLFGDNEGNDLGNIFTSVLVTIDRQELVDGSLIQINDNTVIKLEFDWEIDDEVDLKAGDWAEIKIPNLFNKDDIKIPNGASGDLKWGDIVVGTYELDDNNNLRVVFNEKLEGFKERNGNVWIWLKFNEDILNEDVKQTIEFEHPIDKSFTITVKPKGETHAISKSGATNENINAEYINWVIDVNTSLEKLENAIIEDKIPEGLELDLDSIEVYELAVGYNGSTNEVRKVENIYFSETGEGFKIELGEIDSAYRIKYKTNIIDHSKSEYKNIAILKDREVQKGDPAEFDIGKLEIGSSIEKSGKGNKGNLNNNWHNSDKITWTIDVNKAELNLKNVSVEDSDLSSELTIDNKTIKIYELNKSGDKWTQGKNVTSNFAFSGFPINLGDLDKKAYRIEFDTGINYTEYQKSNEFTNKAILKVNGESRGEAPAEVIVNRGTLIEKFGKELTSYGDPYIKWTIHVNKANHKIDNATITDTIGEGLKLKKDTIKVYEGNSNTPISSDKYSIEDLGDNKFTVNLGNINSHYRIEYETNIIDPKADLGNEAELIGDGLSGEGITNGSIKTGELKPGNEVKNSYLKSTVLNETVGGVEYDGLNYKDKTMSWKITVDAIKEEITNLTITDTFEPENSMVFLNDTLKVVKIVGDKKVPLEEKIGDNEGVYTLIDNGAGGFVLEFPNGLEKAKYEIYYKTSFDPDEVLKVGGTLNALQSYTNEATFSGKTKDVKGTEKDITNANPTAKYDIEDWIWKAGKKDGVLTKGNNSDERKIKWNIYVNALGQDLKGTNFVITDTLSEGQEYDKESLVVKEYSLNKDGSINVKDITLEESKDYSVVWDDTNNKFTLTFTGGIDKPIMVEFDTKISGVSKEKYKNIANVEGKDINKEYEKGVPYENYNDFLVKDAGVEKVYTDDEINWTLTINESLSDIDAGGVLTDTISSGLVYVNGSLSIKKFNEEILELGTDYTLENTLKESGERELKIIFKDSIKEKYIIKYTTVVVAANGEKVENKAVFNGKKVSGNTGETKTYTVTQYSGGTGSGVRPGSIKIIKHEAGKPHIKLEGVGFELYYFINEGAEEQLVKDKDGNTTHYTNSDGVLEFTGLPLRTYYLREVETLDDYQLLDEPIKIAINEDNTTLQHNISNTKKINITGKKEWINGPDVKPTIKLQLYRNGEAYGKPVELEDGETEHIWKDLAATDSDGKAYVYTVDEVDVPENYGKSRTDDKLTVINTYESPKTDIVGRKNWVNGPEIKPTIWLQLYRNGEVCGEPVILKDGELEYTWEDLARTDEKGINYIYTVKEVDEEGNDFVPENYTKVEEGLTVTNTYVSPKTQVIGKKVWEGGPKEKPTIELQLYRDGKTYGEPVELKDGETEYTWKDLDLTDKDGVKYKYTVDEVKTPYSYRKSISEEGLTITNTYIPPYTPTPQGRIKIIKKALGSNKLLQGAKFNILDSKDRVVDTLTTNSNGEATSKYLPTGQYKIKEINAPEGYILSQGTVGMSIKDGSTTETIIYNELTDPDKPDPEKPIEPEKPTDPENPKDPTEPTDPEDPTTELEEPEDPKGGTDVDKEDEDDPTIGLDDNTPKGGTDVDKPTLPKTGENNNIFFYFIGLILITLGFVFRRKTA